MMNRNVSIFLLLGLFCVINAQNLNELVPGLDKINKTELIENAQNAFREKCTKNGGEDAFDNVFEAKDVLQECVETHLHAENITEELEAAKKTGSMDDVFGKYCNKTPQVIQCVKSFTARLEECLEQQEKDNVKIILNVTESLTSFLCHKDGDRMAMFIAEGGLECIESKKDEIQTCANETFSKRIPTDFNPESVPMLLFESQDCSDFDEFHDCTVERLETCKEHTPANVIDALFKFIRKHLPCKSPRVKPEMQHNRLVRNASPDDTITTTIPSILPGSVTSDPPTNIYSKVGEIIESKCRRYGPSPNSFKQVEASSQEFKKCFQDNLGLLFNGQKPCLSIKLDVRKCARKFLSNLTSCLSPKEKYIESLTIDFLNNGMNYICDKNGRNIQGLLSQDGFECMANGNVDSIENCYRDAEGDKEKIEDVIVLTKDVFCRDAETYRKCLKTYVSQQCKSIPYFSANVSHFFYHMNTPCRNMISGERSSLAMSSNVIILTIMSWIITKMF